MKDDLDDDLDDDSEEQPDAEEAARARRRGVEPLLCETLIDRVIKVYRQIPVVADVASICGFSPATLSRWLKLGEALSARIDELEIDLDDLSEREQLQVRVFRELRISGALKRRKLVVTWQKAARGDWRAAKELLARLDNPTWGTRTAIKSELTGANGGPIRASVNLSGLSEEALLKVLSATSDLADDDDYDDDED